MLKVLSTNDAEIQDSSKTLLYAAPGWGKTTQAVNYRNAFGNGLVLSAESGLRTLMKEKIDYVKITSWDKGSEPLKAEYSFRDACSLMAEDDFRDHGYAWIMVDSLSEVADMLLNELEKEYEDKKNKLAMWGDYARLITGACKWLRDLPYHIVVTCLARTIENENGDSEHLPMIKGNAAQTSIMGIFDYIFAGVRITHEGKVRRFILTDETKGYTAKARDPNRRLKAVEETSNVAQILKIVGMDDSDFDAMTKALENAKEKEEANDE